MIFLIHFRSKPRKSILRYDYTVEWDVITELDNLMLKY